MSIITRFGLWLVRISAPEMADPEVRAAVMAVEGNLTAIEQEIQEARRRLAFAIVDAKAANILHLPDNEARMSRRLTHERVGDR